MTRPQQLLRRLAPYLFFAAILLVVAACVPQGATTGSGSPTPSHTQLPLQPAKLSGNPLDLFAWAFTPIFQTLFIALVVLDSLTGNMLIAILLLTVILKLLTTPITRKQLVSSRQTQLLAPEVKAIQAKYKGDRVKQQAAVQEFYRQRGINPAGGCLPALLTMGLLIPMYSVFSQGLTNHDITAMLRVGPIDFGQILGIDCQPGATTGAIFNQFGQVTNPCLDPYAFGINWGIPEPYTTGLFILGFGVSILAIGSALVQLLSSRQMLPPLDPRMADDPNTRVQRQMALFLPLISVLYGGIVPAGLMLYWIVSGLLSIGQQFLVLGYGGMFPLFGWHPEFAKHYRPRYHVTLPEPKPIEPGKEGSQSRILDDVRDATAQSTIRPNRNKSGRRGRRR